MKKLIFITLLFLLIGTSHSGQREFKCSLTLFKNTCWKDYEVQVNVIDINKKSYKSAKKAIIKKGKFNTVLEFPCESSQYLSFHASFTPTIWQGEKDKTYPTKKIWVVPYEIADDALKWNVKLYFPKDFQRVPMPPTALRNCKYIEKIDDEEEEKTDTPMIPSGEKETLDGLDLIKKPLIN